MNSTAVFSFSYCSKLQPVSFLNRTLTLIMSDEEITGMNPRASPWTQIPPQSSGVLYPPTSSGLFD